MAQLILGVQTPVGDFAIPGSGSDQLIGVVELNRDFLVQYNVDSDDVVLKVGMRTKTDGKITGVDDVDSTEVDGSLGRFWRFSITIPTGTTAGDYWLIAYLDDNIETDAGTIKASKVSYGSVAVIMH